GIDVHRVDSAESEHRGGTLTGLQNVTWLQNLVHRGRQPLRAVEAHDRDAVIRRRSDGEYDRTARRGCGTSRRARASGGWRAVGLNLAERSHDAEQPAQR